MGLDGAPPDLFAEAASVQHLPNLRKIASEGCSGSLRSVYPYVTAPAWASILTGTEPGKHGIFDMFRLSETGMEPVNLRDSKMPYLWEYLSWAAKKVIVAGVPFIYPAPPVNGVYVTGRFVPRLSTYPNPLRGRTDLRGYEYEEVGEFSEQNIEKIEQVLVAGSQSVSKRMLVQFRERTSTVLELLNREKWDAAFLIESLPDEILHISYDDKMIVEEMYRAIDDFLGKITAMLNPEQDLLLVVSDHGFGDCRMVFHLTQWLVSKGLIHRKESKAERSLRLIGITPDALARGGLISSLYRAALRVVPSLTASLRNRFAPAFFADSTQADGQSKVKVLGINEPLAWIKLNPNTDPQTLELLVSDLSNLEINGQRVLKNVFMVKDLYHGPSVGGALGDVLVECRDGFAIETKRMSGAGVLAPPIRTKKGCHRQEGIFAGWGQCMQLDGLRPIAYDVAPTILHFFSLPVPDIMDGNVIPLFRKESEPGKKPPWMIKTAEKVTVPDARLYDGS